MRQQVNLYQPSEVARATELAPFTGATAVLLAAAVFAGLLGVWGFGVWRVDRLERALQSVRLEAQRQQETLAALSAARSTGVTPEQLDAKAKSLSAALDIRARALELLRQGAAGRLTGFSARIAALARRSVEGLWLDHVVLSGLDGAMSVDGSTLDPDLVPRYLKGLAAERAFEGVRFDDFVIERPAAGSLASGQGRPFTFRADSSSLRTAQPQAHS